MRIRVTCGRIGPLGFLAFIAIGLVPSDAAGQACMVTTPVGTVNDIGTAVAIQSDGKIVLAGYAWNGTDDDFAVVRYNPDFTLDLSFGTGGIVMTPIGGAEDRAEAMVLQPDGKIVVVGHKNSGAGNNDFAVVRYNVDGTLDTTFNPGGGSGGPPNLAGMVVTAVTGGDDELEGVAIQPNGQIVVAGFSQRATLDYVAARYDADGSLDTAGFNAPNGFFISTNGASNDVANAVAIQPSDGKIVLSGWAHSGANEDFAIARLNADGTFDGGFGSVLINFAANDIDIAHTVIIQPSDGKILVGGEARDATGFGTFGAARLNPDGSLDGTFGTGGLVSTSFTAAHDVSFGMALQSDDHIVLGGYANWTGAGTSADFALLRYDDVGGADNTFDVDSKVTTDISGNNDWLDALAMQSDGKIVAAGYSRIGANDDFTLVRYNSDGSIDDSCVVISYRSIGTNGGILDNVGNASIAAGTNVVTFAGGASLPVPTAVGAVGTGDVLILDPGPSQEIVHLRSRDTATRVTTQLGAMATHANVPFEIRRAYTTLQAWEEAHDGNLSGENRREIGVAYKDGPFNPPYASANAALLFSGSSTDPDRYMHLTVATGQRHGGIAGAGVVVDGQAVTKFGVLDQEDYTRLDGLELVRFRTAGDAGFAAIVTQAAGAIYKNLLIHDFFEPTVVGEGVRVSTAAGPWNFTLRNSVLYNGDRSGIRIDEPTATVTVDNCTVYDMETYGVSIGASGGTMTVTNTISMNHGTGSFDAGSGTLNQSFNISSDATATGGGSLINRTATDNAFPGAGNWVVFEKLTAPEDLHLKNSAENDALDGANDLSPSFWRDIDTQSRFGVSWDFGADELVCTLYHTDEDPNVISRVDVDGTRLTPLLSIPPAADIPRGIALDVAGGKMYWAEGGTKIRRANLDGSGAEDLVTGLSVPRDIDLDLAAGKMYWTDSGTGRIQRANLDGTVVENLLAGLATPRAGPALDLTAGKMYWTEDGSNRVRRSNLDGTVVENLVTTGLGGPFGIAVDPGAGKMYWADYQTDKIQRANLDGTVVEDLVTTGLAQPRGIELDLGAGKMYWVDYGAGKIQRANLDGTVVEDVLTGLSAPSGITLGCNIPAALVPTAVELTSFTATAVDGAVVLEWETGSEMNNLGFHLYRAERADGPYQLVTADLIPGLGSSPAGARYRHVDSGLGNGVTYFYELEDVETTGKTERHGPVSATPSAAAEPTADDTLSSLITFGDPARNAVDVSRRGLNEVVITLRTEGFYAEPHEGGVAITIPGFEDVGGPVPVERQWIEAIAGRRVRLVSVRADEVAVFDGLRPSAGFASEVEVSRGGEIRVSQRRRSVEHSSSSDVRAHIVDVAFQGEVKKALVELAPMTWDGVAGRLTLARRLVVRIAFYGVERDESNRRRARIGRLAGTDVLTRLVTEAPGLYAVGYDDVFGRRRARSIEVALSRGGRPVPYHVEPAGQSFGPGSMLYFLSEGAAANANENQAVYELSFGDGARMQRREAAPFAPILPYAWRRIEREENRLYQPTLVDAPDLWLWDALFAPVKKSYPFQVVGLVQSADDVRLRVWLQGATDLPTSPDHHVEVFVNKMPVGEVFVNGKRNAELIAAFSPRLLREGENVLEIENVADTSVAYSMVMLNKFAVIYPSDDVAATEAFWAESGTAEVAGARHVIDVSDHRDPAWLDDTHFGDGGVRFRVEAHRRYLALGPALRPTLRSVSKTMLRDRARADYVVIGPKVFLEAVQPLIAERRRQGLMVRTASVEDIVSEFGYGERGPDAVRDFIVHAYHQWSEPSLRYVLLVGDASYDPKDFLGTGVVDHVPAPSVRTRFLWTASDPAYAAVHGDDELPDIAIGRLPASSVEEVDAMVAKILAHENGGRSLQERIVLIADDPDEAGDFVAHAQELSRTTLSGLPAETISLAALGATDTHRAIVSAFDEGASMMSYLGHGGIQLWAGEGILANRHVASLAAQERHPVLLTMNCLNGYFHFPYFDSLAEALLTPRDRGVVAAFSPSGLSLDGPAHRYHAALLAELVSGEHERLGDAVLAAQKAYADTGELPELLSIYHLLGDPALTIR